MCIYDFIVALYNNAVAIFRVVLNDFIYFAAFTGIDFYFLARLTDNALFIRKESADP